MITGSPLFTAYIVVIAQEILELGLATAFAVSLNAISLVNSAKGTILLSLGAPSRLCFEKFIDAIIDLLIPG
jgi:hypothetical protein